MTIWLFPAAKEREAGYRKVTGMLPFPPDLVVSAHRTLLFRLFGTWLFPWDGGLFTAAVRLVFRGARLTRDSPTSAVFTQITGGKPSRIFFHVFPSSADPYSCPLRVPK